MKPIVYTSEQDTDYAKEIGAANTLTKLRTVVFSYGDLVPDAMEAVEKMTDQDFEAWRIGLAKERKGKFAGEEFADKYGSVLMPEVMMKVSMVADQFGAPFGLAYIRLKEAGRFPTLAKVTP